MTMLGTDCSPCCSTSQCVACTDGAKQLVIEIEYPGGSGIVTGAGNNACLGAPHATCGDWSSYPGFDFGEVSQSCEPSAEGKKINRVVVTSGGEGYTSAPSASSTCGATLFTRITSPVASVDLVSSGSGYTTPPAVSMPSTSGIFATQQASLSCELSASVTSLVRGNRGSGYTSPPNVTLTGGGGSGATALATITTDGRINTLVVTNGGSGYKTPPAVSFSGGGGSGATATSRITGVVARVIVNTPGLYEINSGHGSQAVTFTGGGGSGAAAQLNWSGTVTSVAVQRLGSGAGENCESSQITFSGGGGSGAEAYAVLSTDETIVIDFGGCVFSDSSEFDYPADSTNGKFPRNYSESTATPIGESVRWDVRVDLSLSGGTTSSAAPLLWFSGEAFVALIDRWWGGSRTAFGRALIERKYLARRNLTRTQPAVKVVLGGQPSASVAAEFGLTWQQLTDEKGDPYWQASAVSVVSGGENLAIDINEPGPVAVQVQPVQSNALGFSSVGQVAASCSWSAPTVAFATIVDPFGQNGRFAEQPLFQVTFRQVLSGNMYEIDTIAILSGGQVEPYTSTSGLGGAQLTLATGRVVQLADIRVSISGGAVTSVTLNTRGLFRGPATVLSAQITPSGRAAGSETVLLETQYSQPTVAALPPLSGRTFRPGSGASFEAVLSQLQDAAGNPCWTISSINILSAGDWYANGERLRFSLLGGSTEQSPALATVSIPPRRMPIITSAYVNTSTGTGAQFSVMLRPAGSGLWEVDQVTVVAPGANYNDREYLVVLFDEKTEWVPGFYEDLYVRTNPQTGAVIGVDIDARGRMYAQDRHVVGVTIHRGGRFYKTTTITRDVPVAVSCLGSLASWELVGPLSSPNAEGQSDWLPSVGGFYSVIINNPGPEYIRYTRRCGTPNVSASIQ